MSNKFLVKTKLYVVCNRCVTVQCRQLALNSVRNLSKFLKHTHSWLSTFCYFWSLM